jgi:methylenetetrahydrofolate reductase (NADPH)
MSTLAGSALLVQNGVDAIMQLNCRNRNRIALLGDLFGAAALGVTSLLLVRGQKLPKELKPRPKAVLDISATELIATAMKIKSDERLGEFPDFFLGGSVTPLNPRANWVPRKLIENIDAGAQFVQMPICMDIDLLRRYMKHLVDNKLIRRVSVMAATPILYSADDARWLREDRPSVQIPDAIIERLDRAKDPDREGLDICIEHLLALADIPGISGATIMPGAKLQAIPEVVEAAGLNR